MSFPFSSSCLIVSPMALNPLAFSCPFVPPKAISGRMVVRCFCAVRKDGSLTQSGAAAQVQIKCSFTNKVYEDRVMGIACYIDEKGEIVCEGYDEGPRTDASGFFGHLRDGDIGVEVIELLERSWLQLPNGSRSTMEAEHSSEDFLN